MKILYKNLDNIVLLYFLFIISFIYLIYFASIDKINIIIIFIITGFIISFFNKNMIIILFFSLIISYIYEYGFIIQTQNEIKIENINNDNTDLGHIYNEPFKQIGNIDLKQQLNTIKILTDKINIKNIQKIKTDAAKELVE